MVEKYFLIFNDGKTKTKIFRTRGRGLGALKANKGKAKLLAKCVADGAVFYSLV